MSRPIKATPILTGIDADKFLSQIAINQNIKTGPVPTPKTKHTIKRIMADARRRREEMAVYKYFCTDCKKTTEIMKKMSDIDNPENCVCGKPMKRLLCESTFKINGYSEANGYSKTSINSRK